MVPQVSTVIPNATLTNLCQSVTVGPLTLRTTAGNVAFYGTMEGWFKAVDARTGQELWKFKTGSGIIGQPVTYKGPDGRQYVAILSGVGGWSGAIVAGGIDPRDSSAALGFVATMTDLPAATNKGGTLYVFSLP